MVPALKLSRQFYERFGDKLVNELVELLNQVETAYRSALREQNELNFVRFEAKLEQRLAEFADQLGKRLEDRFEKRFVVIEKRFDQQSRQFILAWVTLVAAVVGMGLR